jgi:hypothetical protein
MMSSVLQIKLAKDTEMGRWKQANSVEIGSIGEFAPKIVTRCAGSVSERRKM